MIFWKLFFVKKCFFGMGWQSDPTIEFSLDVFSALLSALLAVYLLLKPYVSFPSFHLMFYCYTMAYSIVSITSNNFSRQWL